MTITIDYQAFIVFSSILSLTGTIFAIILSLLSYAKITGIEKATHSVQYVPMDPMTDRENEEFLDENQQRKRWDTSEEALTEQDKVYRKDMEEAGMEEFLSDEEDLKTHSF